MPSTIITKNGSGAPLAADLVAGELAVDLTNGRLYTENSGGSVIEIGLNPSGNVDVTGTVTADGLTVDSSSGITVNGPTNQDGKLNLVAYAGVQDAEARIQAVRGNTSGTDSRLQFLTNNGTSLLTRVDIDDTGDISFYEDTGTTAKFFWDASAESLGIGTTSPAEVLHVTTSSGNSYLEVGRATQAQGEVGLKISGGTSGADWYLYQKPSADTLHFYKTGDRVTIDSSGNVGIGTASPNAALDVLGSSGDQLRLRTAETEEYQIGRNASTGLLDFYGSQTLFTGYTFGGVDGERMRIASSGNVGIGVVPSSWSTVRALQVGHAHVGALVDNAYFGANSYYDGSNWRYIATNEANRIDMQAGNIQFWTAPSGTAGDILSQTQAMTLDSSGNLLVGTTDTTAFDGTSGINIGGNSNALAFSATGNNQMLIYSKPTGLQFYDSTNNADRMLLDNSGNLLVGTTSAGYLAAQDGVIIYQNGSMRLGGDGTAARNLMSFVNGTDGTPAEVGTIQTSGSTTSYNTSSDYRLKENVVAISGATERLKQLKPSRFNFIADPDTTVDGFLAHEVQDIVPEAITGTKDAVDAEGNPEYQGIDQSKLVPLLVATIQELEARIAALEGAN